MFEEQPRIIFCCCSLTIKYISKILHILYVLDANESDEFTDNDASSFSKSESSTEYFSSASGGTENTSACSSLSR